MTNEEIEREADAALTLIGYSQPADRRAITQEIIRRLVSQAYEGAAQMLSDGAETLRTDPSSTDMSDDARLRVRLALDVYAERIRALKPSAKVVSQPTS